MDGQTWPHTCNVQRSSCIRIYSQWICWVSISGAEKWWHENARPEKPEESWNLAGTVLEPSCLRTGTFLDPLGNLPGTLSELCWNLAKLSLNLVRLVLELCWHLAGTLLELSWNCAGTLLEPFAVGLQSWANFTGSQCGRRFRFFFFYIVFCFA